MSTSLAVKYRPQTLDEVVEQEITVKILSRVIASRQFKNCYLFAGPSGDGKTTLARIFAKAINNGVGEPIEIDAASNNGVENVRSIIDAANSRSLTGEYKIFIIDECHAITSAGWQAFLKGIEEPPKYTIFIFCTTEPSKIPVTILNRVQRYNISKITNAGIEGRLQSICQAEGFTNYTEACNLISKLAHGSMRDAITYLDQCADYSKDLSLKNVQAVLGDIAAEVMIKVTNYLIDGNANALLATLDSIYKKGNDLRQFINDYLDFVLDLNKYIIFKDITLTNIPVYLETTENKEVNVKYAVSINNNLAWFARLSERLLELKQAIKYDLSYVTTIEVFMLKLCRGLN